MISLPLHVLILLILPTITNQQTPNQLSAIDWSKCGLDREAKCNCLSTNMILKEESAKLPTEGPDDKHCNIGIQSKYYNKRGAFFVMQVIGNGEPLGTDPQLALYRGDIVLFGCKWDSKSRKMQLEGDLDYRRLYKIELVEHRSRFEPGNVVCAIHIKKAFQFLDHIKNKPPTKAVNLATTMKLTSTQLFEYNLEANFRIFGANGLPRCDPFEYNNELSSLIETLPDFQILEVPDRYREILNCEQYGPSHTMRYVYGNEKEEMEKLECDQDPDTTNPPQPINPNPFYYKLFKKDATGQVNGVPFEKPELYTLFCTAKFNEICKDPNEGICKHTPSTPNCPIYTKGGPEAPAKLTCPEKKWLIDDEYYELPNDPVCQQDQDSDMNAAAFYHTLPTGLSKEFPKARCFTEFNCEKKTKLNTVNCGDDETKCGKIDYSNGILKCKDDKKHLRIHSYATNETLTATNYTCDKSTGKWINATDNPMPSDSQVMCLGDRIPAGRTTKEASFSDALVWVIIGCGSVGFALLLVGIIVVGYRGRKLVKRLKEEKDEDDWKKLDKAKRIKCCQDTFSTVLQATPSHEVHIVQGFMLLETLLKAESEEAKEWEEVYPFLMRFEGAIAKVDIGICRMFARYMYLQAKKIVDKHGWLSREPIRKKNQKGLLRAVAIRLLSFALYDSANDDAEKLLISGYRKLGFKARAQYPHCGVMWSVLLYAGPNRYKHKTKKEKKKFESAKFMEKLRQIALDGKLTNIPTEEVIPIFGSVTHQAALALGGSPKQDFHQKHAKSIILNPPLQGDVDGGAVARSFFEGMCMMLTRDPLPLMVIVFDMLIPKEKFMDAIHKILPGDSLAELIERTSYILTYYGRSLDAKRLRKCFIPKDPDLGFEKLLVDQRMFEESVDKQMEELREWFAKRTDIDSLKKKPVYITDAKLLKKLDASGDANGEKAAETDAAAPNAAGAAGSGSSSGSSSSADPKAAAPDLNAAAPATPPTPTSAAPVAAAPVAHDAAPAAP